MNKKKITRAKVNYIVIIFILSGRKYGGSYDVKIIHPFLFFLKKVVYNGKNRAMW